MNINKYWRLKRDDDELDKFIDFLKSEYNYVENEKQGHKFYPSKVSRINSPSPDTIIVTLTFGNSLTSFLERFSVGECTIDGKLTKLMISWNDDNEKKIVDFDSTYLRRKKLEKINRIS